MQRLAQIVARRRQEARLGEVGELELVGTLDHTLPSERRIGILQARAHAVEIDRPKASSSSPW